MALFSSDAVRRSSADEGASAGVRHDAFISYSRMDIEFAAALEAELENFRAPREIDPNRRHLDIFRDVSDFAGTTYYAAIERHLGRSAKLIVICSPRAATSKYVNDEIRRFLKRDRVTTEDVIPVLLSGIPNNECTAANRDQGAFPEALAEAVDIPIAANYLLFDTKEHKLHKAPYIDSWHFLLANLYGRSRGEIEQRLKRREARILRLRLIAASALIAILSIALAYALYSQRETTKARDVAENERRIAEGRRVEAELATGRALKSESAARRAQKRAESAAIAENVARKEAEHQSTLAFARQLAAESQADARSGPASYRRALFLAAGSLNAAYTDEGIEALRFALTLVPRFLAAPVLLASWMSGANSVRFMICVSRARETYPRVARSA